MSLHTRTRFTLIMGILVLCGLLLAACQPAVVSPATEEQPAATGDPNLAALQAAWKGSPHADTYDPSKGPNTYCARCHSPQNWDPAAVIDPPPNCVTCKFSFEQEMRFAAGNPLVAEQYWKDIGCETCHLVEAGEVQAELAWLDVETGYHETVSSPTGLCEFCHTDTETLRHRRDLGSAAHAGFTCVDCHDAHSTAASCTTAGCHPALDAGVSTPGHDADHASVACVACHDAAGLVVKPVEGEAVWMTQRTTSLLGRETTQVYQSHALQGAVDCARCHSVGNVWGLSVQPGAGP